MSRKFFTILFVAALIPGIAQADEKLAAFSIETPDGWTMDKDVGKRQGVDLALYPKGGSWAASGAVIYVRVTDKRDKSAQKVMDDDISTFKEGAPDAVVKDQTGMFTADGKLVFVKRMEDAKSDNVEVLAYIPEEKNRVTIIALDSKTKKASDKAMPAFKKLVESYKSNQTADAEEVEKPAGEKEPEPTVDDEEEHYDYVPAGNRARTMEYKEKTSN